MPIPFFAFRTIYDEVARSDWKKLGDLPPFEMVDQGLVLSALAHPFATAGGREVYPTVRAKAAALFRGLVKNHGLHDGNKRLAVTCLTVFLLANGWLPRYSNLQLYRYALRVARREGAYPVGGIERWIRRNVALMSDGDLEVLRIQNREFGDPSALEAAFRPILMGPADIKEMRDRERSGEQGT
jgi:death-on-curing protein